MAEDKAESEDWPGISLTIASALLTRSEGQCHFYPG
jgi:hypothetical protein